MLLAVVALGLLAARPLFEPRLVQAIDTLAHFYLLIHLDDLIQQGIYYSRWLPYRISGLGEPVFQYYPPLASYIAHSFRLLGLEPLSALRLTFGLTLVGGGVGIYLWVRANKSGPLYFTFKKKSIFFRSREARSDRC